MRALVLPFLFLLNACASTASAPSSTGERSGDGPFLADQTGLDRAARQSLATAELQALQFGQAGQAVPWSIGASQSGTVSASQPFRVAERECRRLVYSWDRREAVQTVCRDAGNVWEVVG